MYERGLERANFLAATYRVNYALFIGGRVNDSKGMTHRDLDRCSGHITHILMIGFRFREAQRLEESNRTPTHHPRAECLPPSEQLEQPFASPYVIHQIIGSSTLSSPVYVNTY
jgi:hypothetical protein